jgi:hypothetical protein
MQFQSIEFPLISSELKLNSMKLHFGQSIEVEFKSNLNWIDLELLHNGSWFS